MNIKALVTTLILGTSSVAMAKPVTVVSASAHAELSYGSTRPAPRTLPAPIVRDHRTTQPVIVNPPVSQAVDQRRGGWRNERPIYQPVPRPRLIASSLAFNTDTRKMLSGDFGRIGTLRIDNNRGRTLITQVVVKFTNGQKQVIRNINRTLSGNEALSITLDGGGRRSVGRIVVYGQDLNNGFRSDPGEFAVSAL